MRRILKKYDFWGPDPGPERQHVKNIWKSCGMNVKLMAWALKSILLHIPGYICLASHYLESS